MAPPSSRSRSNDLSASEASAFLEEPLLSGQEHLLAVLSSSRAQSYLVSSPPETDVEEAARLLARFWLGVGPSDDPADLAVFEDVRMATVRQVIEEAWTKPIELDRRAVVLVLGARPNREVQNALLRLTEEPPPHLGIFLVATTSQMLPATLRSRLIPLLPHPLPARALASLLVKWRAIVPDTAMNAAVASGGWVARALHLSEPDVSALASLREAGAARLSFVEAADRLPKDRKAFVDGLATEFEGLAWSTAEPRYVLAADASWRARAQLDRNANGSLVIEVLLQQLADLGVLKNGRG